MGHSERNEEREFKYKSGTEEKIWYVNFKVNIVLLIFQPIVLDEIIKGISIDKVEGGNVWFLKCSDAYSLWRNSEASK